MEKEIESLSAGELKQGIEEEWVSLGATEGVFQGPRGMNRTLSKKGYCEGRKTFNTRIIDFDLCKYDDICIPWLHQVFEHRLVYQLHLFIRFYTFYLNSINFL